MNISNNIPIDPGSKFSTATRKICYHSFLKKNSNKSTTIYHYCYLNGETNVKVRARVENRKEITILSDQELKTTNKGNWKVKITHVDKKILDTHIFELA